MMVTNLIFAVNSRKQKSINVENGRSSDLLPFERLPENQWQKYCSKRLEWSLQQRVLFRIYTGFPFINT
jgi:hypothetical protein